MQTYRTLSRDMRRHVLVQADSREPDDTSASFVSFFLWYHNRCRLTGSKSALRHEDTLSSRST